MRRADYFVSDVHLAPERPAVTERFLRFLDRVAADGARLFLLGDIFDAWVGVKQERLPYVAPVLASLRALTESGVEVHYLAGNRDFNFDARVNGAAPRRLPDVLRVESCGRRLVLLHGDLFCTADRAYRRARRIRHALPLRLLHRSIGLRASTFLGDGLRRLSTRAVARKPEAEKAVDYSRILALLDEGNDAVVCGHVHRAARYRVRLDGGRCGELITLGGWSPYGVYLVGRRGALALRKFP